MTQRTIDDLSQVSLRVRVVRFGWRAQIGALLIRLGAWVGGSHLQFIGDTHQ